MISPHLRHFKASKMGTKMSPILPHTVIKTWLFATLVSNEKLQTTIYLQIGVLAPSPRGQPKVLVSVNN